MKLFALLICLTTVAHADGGTIHGTVTIERGQGVSAGPVLVYVVGFQEKAVAKAVVKQVGK